MSCLSQCLSLRLEFSAVILGGCYGNKFHSVIFIRSKNELNIDDSGRKWENVQMLRISAEDDSIRA